MSPIERVLPAVHPHRPTRKFPTIDDNRAYSLGKYDARFRIDRQFVGRTAHERRAYFDGLVDGARWEGEMALARRAEPK